MLINTHEAILLHYETLTDPNINDYVTNLSENATKHWSGSGFILLHLYLANLNVFTISGWDTSGKLSYKSLQRAELIAWTKYVHQSLEAYILLDLLGQVCWWNSLGLL